MGVEQNLLPDDGGNAGEAFLPAGVTQDYNRTRAGRLIFFRQKATPEGRFYS